MSSDITIGQRIKQIRKEIGLSQKDLANKLKMHATQLARYEVGRIKPSLDAILKIARFCEVSVDYLLDGENKELTKMAKIYDQELLELTRKVDKLNKGKRDKIKWVIQGMLSQIEHP